MTKILSSLENLESMKGKALGKGREGECFQIRETPYVLKIYDEKERPKEVKFDDLNSLYIAFPKDTYIDKDNNIIGISMPFVPGCKFDNGFPLNLEITKLKEAYNILLKEIEKFPDIYMYDMCLDNILYDENTNRFYLIDINLWKELKDSFGLNYARLDLNLSHALYKNVSWLKEYEFLKDNKELYYCFNQS